MKINGQQFTHNTPSVIHIDSSEFEMFLGLTRVKCLLILFSLFNSLNGVQYVYSLVYSWFQ